MECEILFRALASTGRLIFQLKQRVETNHQMNILAQLVFYIMAFGIPVALILLHVLHKILPKVFDNIWFNKDHFNEAELAIYSSYPLNLVKTLAYICAISLPSLVKKRFGDMSIAEQAPLKIKRLVNAFIYAVILVFLASISVMISSS